MLYILNEDLRDCVLGTNFSKLIRAKELCCKTNWWANILGTLRFCNTRPDIFWRIIKRPCTIQRHNGPILTQSVSPCIDPVPLTKYHPVLASTDNVCSFSTFFALFFIISSKRTVEPNSSGYNTELWQIYLQHYILCVCTSQISAMSSNPSNSRCGRQSHQGGGWTCSSDLGGWTCFLDLLWALTTLFPRGKRAQCCS